MHQIYDLFQFEISFRFFDPLALCHCNSDNIFTIFSLYPYLEFIALTNNFLLSAFADWYKLLSNLRANLKVFLPTTQKLFPSLWKIVNIIVITLQRLPDCIKHFKLRNAWLKLTRRCFINNTTREHLVSIFDALTFNMALHSN